MRQIVGTFVVVLALAALASCAKMRGDTGTRERQGIGTLGKQEMVVIELRMEAGTCKIHQRTPPDIRTQSGAMVRWLFVGQCDGGIPIEIRPQLMDADGKSHSLFDLTDKNTRLVAQAPATENRPPVRLSAKLIDNLRKGRYKYQLWIDNKPAEYNAEADRGDFFACPFWPCGDFEAY